MGYRLDWEPVGIYWKYYGNISGEDVIDASTSIYGDQRFDTLKYKLVDFLDVESIKMDKDEVALIAYQHRSAERSNPYVKNAIVIKSSGSEMAKKFAAFFSDSSWEVRIFQDLDEANNWLGRKPSC
ncbi:MAG: hypothetical protein KAT61_06110 [Gammaproteobacteria bacterium]|nr:hypothetical protein [Gammaproteobacteria bacterium]